jgi:outer membrane protein assembly factor BamB
LTLSLLAGPAAAQSESVFLPTPRELKQHLSRARTALAEKQYADAVLELGALLTNSTSNENDVEQDFFVGPTGKTGTTRSLKAVAEELLGSMPREGRDLYELKFGSEAQELLGRAVEENDVTALTEVTRRYFHTKAGYQATMLLGRRHLDQGRALAGALAFERIRRSPAIRQRFEPELSVLSATCWRMAGMEAKSREVLSDLRERSPNATLRVGGAPLAIFRAGQDPYDLIAKLTPRESSSLGGSLHWVMHRGSANRNAASVGGAPLAKHRWRIPTANHPKDETLVKKIHLDLTEKGAPIIPVVQPLAVNDVILMRSARRLIAVDFRSGKRVWVFPWDEKVDERAEAQRRAGGDTGSHRETEVRQRLWEDAPFGQFSSDGQQIFVLHELQVATQANRRHVFVNQGAVQDLTNTRNELVSLDLKTQGKLRWSVGGATGGDEPRLSGAFFLGAPLPLLGRLYVLAEVKGEVRLVVLDGATGQLEWQQQLAHLDNKTIEQDPERRLAGASPSYADGVLVCPTSGGAVVALELATRSLRWGHQYKRKATTNSNTGVVNTPAPALGQRWVDATITISRGRVLITPPESNELICLDLVSGERLWTKPRGDWLYTACVYEDAAVLVGRKSIGAFSLKDGDQIWTNPYGAGQPSGRGFRSDRYYFVPTSAAQLIKYELDGGGEVERISTEEPLGNLICFQNEIVSQSAEWMMAFYQIAPLRDRVAAALKTASEDIWALTRQSELYLQDGDQPAALRLLQQTMRLAPDNVTVKTLFVETILDSLDEDFARHAHLAPQAEQLIKSSEQEMRLLRAQVKGKHSLGESSESFATLLRLIDLTATSPVNSSLESVELGRRVAGYRWIQEQASRIFTEASDDERTTMLTALNNRFESAAGGGITQLRRFVRYFGGVPEVANRARVELASQLLRTDSLLEAEQYLASISPTAPLQKEIDALHAMIAVSGGSPGSAADKLRRLQQQWPDAKLLDGKTAQELAAQARAKPRIKDALDAAPDWKDGMVLVEPGEPTGPQYQSYRRIYPIQIEEMSGPSIRSVRLAFNQRNNSILVSDNDGRYSRTISLESGPRFYTSDYSTLRASLYGHLAVVAIGNSVYGIDLLRDVDSPEGPLLWKKSLSAKSNVRTQIMSRRRSLLGINFSYNTDINRIRMGELGPVTGNGVILQTGQQLVCLDPLTGEDVWTRNETPAGSLLYGDGERVFVHAANSELVEVFSFHDGRKLGERKAPKTADVMRTIGGKVLSHERVGANIRLRLIDVWNQQDLFDKTVPANTYGDFTGHGELAIMNPDGKLTVISLTDGATALEKQLRPEPTLTNIYVLGSSDSYVVATSTPARHRPERTITPAPAGVLNPMITGRVYCLDRHSGATRWITPATVTQFSLPMNQPTELPLIFFLRHVTVRQANKSNSAKTSILCLDKRDGRIVHWDDRAGPQINSFTIGVNPAGDEVVLELDKVIVKFQLTDEPPPPAPPAYLLGEQTSPIQDFVKFFVRGVKKALPVPGSEPAPRKLKIAP